MQKELRIIELIESCMRGENTVYLTTAPTAEIKAACRLYRYDDEKAAEDLFYNSLTAAGVVVKPISICV